MEHKSGEAKKSKTTSLGTPKNFLIPIMLLHLRDWNSHGYELMEKIMQFGVESVDQGNFYRLLRQLEKDELVTYLNNKRKLLNISVEIELVSKNKNVGSLITRNEL